MTLFKSVKNKILEHLFCFKSQVRGGNRQMTSHRPSSLDSHCLFENIDILKTPLIDKHMYKRKSPREITTSEADSKIYLMIKVILGLSFERLIEICQTGPAGAF